MNERAVLVQCMSTITCIWQSILQLFGFETHLPLMPEPRYPCILTAVSEFLLQYKSSLILWAEHLQYVYVQLAVCSCMSLSGLGRHLACTQIGALGLVFSAWNLVHVYQHCFAAKPSSESGKAIKWFSSNLPYCPNQSINVSPVPDNSLWLALCRLICVLCWLRLLSALKTVHHLFIIFFTGVIMQIMYVYECKHTYTNFTCINM